MRYCLGSRAGLVSQLASTRWWFRCLFVVFFYESVTCASCAMRYNCSIYKNIACNTASWTRHESAAIQTICAIFNRRSIESQSTMIRTCRIFTSLAMGRYCLGRRAQPSACTCRIFTSLAMGRALLLLLASGAALTRAPRFHCICEDKPKSLWRMSCACAYGKGCTAM
jgi:hypothetical protein